MTVTYLKDGRIEVKDPRDALLLRLAGIVIETFEGKIAPIVAADKLKAESSGYNYNIIMEAQFPIMPNQYMPETRLYVPADVAKGLTNKNCTQWLLGDDIASFEEYHSEDIVYMRRHNDRWNLLPEIEMEK